MRADSTNAALGLACAFWPRVLAPSCAPAGRVALPSVAKRWRRSAGSHSTKNADGKPKRRSRKAAFYTFGLYRRFMGI